MKLFLVRHGQTKANQQKVFQGWLDLPLSEEGRKEALWLRERLQNQQLDQVFISPLIRARETAEIILEGRVQALSLQSVDALKEMNFGEWEGLSEKEISAQTPEVFQRWIDDWQQIAVPGGESAAEMFIRVQRWVDSLVQITSQTKNILIVTHEGVIVQIISHLLGLGLDGIWRFRVEPGSLSVVQINHGFASLRALNIRQ